MKGACALGVRVIDSKSLECISNGDSSNQFSSTTHPFPLNKQKETSLLLKLHFVMALYIKAFNILIYMVIDDCKIKFNLAFVVIITSNGNNH